MAAADTSTLTQSRAEAKYVRLSARKARLVLDHIRGRSVPEARTILAFTSRAAAVDIEKVLRSAVANAESAHGLDGDELVVLAAYADEGPTLKRWRARARGRVNRIRKRTCHITLIVSENPKAAARPKRSAEKPAADDRPRTRRTRRRREAEAQSRRRRRRRLLPDGPEDPSWRPTRRCHPRLEVELVHRQEGVRRLHPRGCPHPRAHHRQAVACRPVRHPDPQGQAADHGRHLHGPPGHRDRQVGRRGRRAPQGAALDHRQVGAHQHQRDQAARARRAARRPVDRRAAAEPRLVPARDEARARLGHAVGCAGHQDPVRRPARRRRDEPLGALHRGSRAVAHDPRRHRLRLRRGEDDLRTDRRQGVGQQGRDHAGGLRGHLDGQGDAPRRPGSGPPQARRRGRRVSAPRARAAAAAARIAKASVSSRRAGAARVAALPAAPAAAADGPVAVPAVAAARARVARAVASGGQGGAGRGQGGRAAPAARGPLAAAAARRRAEGARVDGHTDARRDARDHPRREPSEGTDA